MSEEKEVCPNENCGTPIEESWFEGLGEGDSKVCPNCGEIEFTLVPDVDEDGDACLGIDWDKIEKSKPKAKPKAKLKPKAKVESKPKPKPKKKSSKKTGRPKTSLSHDASMDTYVDFFLDHPEGVTIDMLSAAFSLNRQAAYYAQRKTFNYASTRGFETEVSRRQGSLTKYFFIRDKLQ